MNKPSLHLLTLLLITLLAAGCGNTGGSSKSVDPDSIYQYYRISYTEGEPTARVYAQFREGGPAGKGIRLAEPARVGFDFVWLEKEASDSSGTYYADDRDAGLIVGAKHSFVYTDAAGNRYDNGVMINEFGLVDPPDSASRQAPLVIAYALGQGYGLQANDYIELLFSSTDNTIRVALPAGDTATRITLSPQQLQQLNGNEFTLQLILHRKLKLQEQTAAGGEIEVRHALKEVTIELKN